jgi:two-component system, NarL family, invasion response regulator UvrY
MQKQFTVLVADGDRFARECLRTLLAEIGSINFIAEAKNGEEAISLAAAHHPDIVIMDISMSPVNGFEAARKILKQDFSVKIIGWSLHAEPSYCRNMMRLGARAYVSKSAHQDEIITAIQEVMAGRIYISKDMRGKF